MNKSSAQGKLGVGQKQLVLSCMGVATQDPMSTETFKQATISSGLDKAQLAGQLGVTLVG